VLEPSAVDRVDENVVVKVRVPHGKHAAVRRPLQVHHVDCVSEEFGEWLPGLGRVDANHIFTLLPVDQRHVRSIIAEVQPGFRVLPAHATSLENLSVSAAGVKGR
jgi:hypothetical protein